jgi:superfamily I DNA/RNA helicase
VEVDLLATLDPEQREVASAFGQPVCVIAGAGTGKTRAITHRIAHAVAQGHADAARSLALTFTSKAARELRERLSALGVADVQARTFHSAALRQLQYFWPRVERGEVPRLLTSKGALGLQAARLTALDESLVADLISQVEWAKVSLVGPDDFVEHAHARIMPGDLDRDRVADFYRMYEQLKGKDGSIDFDDVLLIVAGLIAENSAVAEQVHDQYRHFTVDEFQDVSPLQQQLLDLWLGDRDDICVVGDPQQTIYSFAGASPDFLRGFAEQERVKVIRLFRDYRSTPQIVEFANRLVPVDNHLVGQQPPGPEPEIVPVSSDETRVVVDRIKSLLSSGVAPADIALLVRTNNQAENFSRALASRGVTAAVRRLEGQEGPETAVTVASLHAAKGLEWEHVFLAGVVEGLLPISYSTSDEEIAEEKRLFYVGVTRARRNLVITYQGQPSRFLAGPTPTAPPAKARVTSVAQCRQCGRALVTAATLKRGRCDSCPSQVDEALLSRLTEWRSRVAAERGMPPFVIATDLTLEALAEVRPTTDDELRAVLGRKKAADFGAEILALFMVQCAMCGAQESSLPLDWVLSRSGEREAVYCVSCARENIRGIEGKLEQEWW